MKKQILVVEDNPKFGAAAMSYFAQQSNVNAEFAFNYQTAHGLLSEKSYGGIITDLFMPRLGNNNDISLGMQVLEKLVSADPYEQKVLSLVQKVSEKVSVDEELRPMLRGLAHSIYTYGGHESHNCVYRSIIQVADTLQHPQVTALILKPSLMFYESKSFDYFTEIKQAMETNPTEQPLGILVGEFAKEKNIPCVFATSTYHHDLRTAPLISYIQKLSLGKVLDCPKENPDFKKSTLFWQQAYTLLQENMEVNP